MTPLPLPVAPPADEAELLARAHALAGLSVGEVAHAHGLMPPRTGRQEKGWSGQVLERALGATAGSLPEPDFAALGIELKTVPIDTAGRPRESTYVCMVPMRPKAGARWQTSLPYRKLRRVLWVPLQVAPGGRDAARVGLPLVWSPTRNQDQVFEQDWSEAMELVALGRFDLLSAELGEALQVRPKAANGASATVATDGAGRLRPTLPRGFYLRRRFTTEILAAALDTQYG